MNKMKTIDGLTCQIGCNPIRGETRQKCHCFHSKHLNGNLATQLTLCHSMCVHLDLWFTFNVKLGDCMRCVQNLMTRMLPKGETQSALFPPEILHCSGSHDNGKLPLATRWHGWPSVINGSTVWGVLHQYYCSVLGINAVWGAWYRWQGARCRWSSMISFDGDEMYIVIQQRPEDWSLSIVSCAVWLD